MSYNNWDGRRGGRGRGKGGNWGWRGRGYNRMAMNNPFLQNLSWTNSQSNYNYSHPEKQDGQNYYSQKQKSYASSHHKTFIPPKPPSPLPGTEEYTQRNIQQHSELIKKQLNIDSDTCSVGDLNLTINSSDCSSKTVETTSSENLNNPNRTAESKKSAKQINKQKNKLSQDIDVQEIHDKIIKHISNLSYSRKINLVNQSTSGYDIAIQEIQKQKRLELSRALRDMSKRQTQNSDDGEVINSIIPDIGIKIENLPKEIIAELSSTLHTDIELHVNKLVDPEACFKQAEEILSFEYGNDLNINENESHAEFHNENSQVINNPFDFEYLNRPLSAEQNSNVLNNDVPFTDFENFNKSNKKFQSNTQNFPNQLRPYVSSSQNSVCSATTSLSPNMTTNTFKMTNNNDNLKSSEQDFTNDIDFCLENFDVSKSYLDFTSRSENKNISSKFTKDIENNPYIRKNVLVDSMSYQNEVDKDNNQECSLQSSTNSSSIYNIIKNVETLEQTSNSTHSIVNKENNITEESNVSKESEILKNEESVNALYKNSKERDNLNVVDNFQEGKEFTNNDFSLQDIDVTKSYLSFRSKSDDQNIECIDENSDRTPHIAVRKDLLNDSETLSKTVCTDEFKLTNSSILVVNKDDNLKKIDNTVETGLLIVNDKPIDAKLPENPNLFENKEQEEDNEENKNVDLAPIAKNINVTIKNEDEIVKIKVSTAESFDERQSPCVRNEENDVISQQELKPQTLELSEPASIGHKGNFKCTNPLSERVHILENKSVNINLKTINSLKIHSKSFEKRNKKKKRKSCIEDDSVKNMEENLDLKSSPCKKEDEWNKTSNENCDFPENSENVLLIPDNIQSTSNISEDIMNSNDVLDETNVKFLKNDVMLTDTLSTEVNQKRWKSPGEKKMMTDISELYIDEKIDIGEVVMQNFDIKDEDNEINLTKSILEQMEEFNRSMMSISSAVSEDNDSNNACLENEDKFSKTIQETLINEGSPPMLSIDSPAEPIAQLQDDSNLKISLKNETITEKEQCPSHSEENLVMRNDDYSGSNLSGDTQLLTNTVKSEQEQLVEDSKCDLKVKIEKMETDAHIEILDKTKQEPSKSKDKRYTSKNKRRQRSKSKDRHSRSKRSESKEKYSEKNKTKDPHLIEVKTEVSNTQKSRSKAKTSSKSSTSCNETLKDSRKVKTPAEKKETLSKMVSISTQTDCHVKTKSSGTLTEKLQHQTKEVQVTSITRSVEIQTLPNQISNTSSKECRLVDYIKKLNEIDKEIQKLMKMKQNIYDDINLESCDMNDLHTEKVENTPVNTVKHDIDEINVIDTQTNMKKTHEIHQESEREQVEQFIGTVPRNRKRKIIENVNKITRTNKRKKQNKVQSKNHDLPKLEISNNSVVSELYPQNDKSHLDYNTNNSKTEKRGPLSIKISLKNLKSTPCRNNSGSEEAAKTLRKSSLKEEKSRKRSKVKVKDECDLNHASEPVDDVIATSYQNVPKPLLKIKLPFVRYTSKKTLSETDISPTKCVNENELDCESITSIKKKRSSKSDIEKLKKLTSNLEINTQKYQDQLSPEAFKRIFTDKCYVLLQRYTTEQLEQMMYTICKETLEIINTTEPFDDTGSTIELINSQLENVNEFNNQNVKLEESTAIKNKNCMENLDSKSIENLTSPVENTSELNKEIYENSNVTSNTDKAILTKSCEQSHTLMNSEAPQCQIEESTNIHNIENNSEFEFKDFTGCILVIKAIDNIILAAGDTGNLYYFNINTGILINELHLSKKPLTSLCINEFNKQIHVGSLSCKMYVLDYNTKEITNTIKFEEGVQCMELAWSYIFIGTNKGQLIRYDIQKGKIEDTLKIYDSNILAIRATQEGVRRVLLLTTRNAHITIRDAMTGLLMRTLESLFYPTVYALLLDKSLVYCGTSHHDILVYTFQDGQLVNKHEATNSRGVVCMKIVGNLLFAGCYNGNVFVYNINTNKFLGQMAGPGGLLLSMEVVQEKVIVGTKSNKLKIWNIPKFYLDQV